FIVFEESRGVDFVVPRFGLPARLVWRVFLRFLGAFFLGSFFRRILGSYSGTAKHKHDRGSSKMIQIASHICLSRGLEGGRLFLHQSNGWCREGAIPAARRQRYRREPTAEPRPECEKRGRP